VAAHQIAPGAYRVGEGGVNVFVIDTGSVTVIDAGLPGRVDRIMAGVRAIGKTPPDVGAILVTHYHADHIGALQTLASQTRARVYAPKGDSALIRSGGRQPPLEGRGLVGSVLKSLMRPRDLPPQDVDIEVVDGDEVDVAGGIRVIATPGHTPGHVSYLWPAGSGTLFAGDAASTFLGKLDVAPVAEDFDRAEQSFVALAGHDFDVAGFGHGGALTHAASSRFRDVAAKYS
jgi:glyoxylase-like metal-dependent hydrolase (beta-lactamase superfamily II)